MTPRTCKHCGGPNLRHANAHYCSPTCKSEAYSERKLQARHERLQRLGNRTCKQCGGPIEEKKHPRTVFCSGRCQREWANEQHTAQRTARRTAARAGRICAAPDCDAVIPPERVAQAIYCSETCKHNVNIATWRAKAAGYNRLYLYGITLEQWQAQLEAQGHRCAICRRADWPGKDNRPHADHDHSLPVFILRGILCGECNVGLGKFCEDPALLRAAADYLEAATAA